MCLPGYLWRKAGWREHSKSWGWKTHFYACLSLGCRPQACYCICSWRDSLWKATHRSFHLLLKLLILLAVIIAYMQVTPVCLPTTSFLYSFEISCSFHNCSPRARHLPGSSSLPSTACRVGEGQRFLLVSHLCITLFCFSFCFLSKRKLWPVMQL